MPIVTQCVHWLIKDSTFLSIIYHFEMFPIKTNGNYFVKEYQLRPCLVKKRADDIYSIFAGVRIGFEYTRRKHLSAHKGLS